MVIQISQSDTCYSSTYRTAKANQAIETTDDQEKQKEAEAEKLLSSVRKELGKRKKVAKQDGKESE